MNRSIGAMCLALAVLLAGCGGGKRTLRLAGSTSIQPFAEMLAQDYESKSPGRRVGVQGGGSTAGVRAVESGLAEIGMCSRDLTEDEAKTFTPIVIAQDGIAMIVHKSNPVKGLTTAQIRRIYTGTVTNWKDVGGADIEIQVITREEGSGTRDTFVQLVMGKESISTGALNQSSNGAVREMVRTGPAAVSYISLGLVNEDVKALNVDGVVPSHATVLDKTYKLARPFLFVVKGAPTAEAQAFIDYVLGADGQRLLESKGLVRAK